MNNKNMKNDNLTKDIDVFDTGGSIWLAVLNHNGYNYVVSNDGLDCLNCYKFKDSYDDDEGNQYFEKDMIFSTNVKNLNGKNLNIYNAMIDKMNETERLNTYPRFKEDYKKIKAIIKQKNMEKER